MKLSQVDLNLLVALDALLRVRNVTQAGRELGLSQPAMSSALARLRRLFDDPLFERVGREYHLTPLARSLVEPLQEALGAIQRTLDQKTLFDPRTSHSSFQLALSDHLLMVFCPQLVARLRALAPHVRVSAHPIKTSVHTDIAARRTDLSIQPTNLVRNCASQPIFEDRWVCVAWSQHASLRDGLTEALLCELPQASFQIGPIPLAEQLITPQLAAKPNIQITTRSFTCLPFLVQGTQTIALVQRSLAEWAQGQADIQVLDLPITLPRLIFEMCWNAAYTTDTSLSWLRDVVVDVAASTFGQPPESIRAGDGYADEAALTS